MSKGIPYTSDAATLERAIGHLEGWAFGRWFLFSTLGYNSQLHVSFERGWQQIPDFNGLPGLAAFSGKLNDAILPILDQYADELRQALANEAVSVAARALDGVKND